MRRWRTPTLWVIGISLATLVVCGLPATLVKAWLNDQTEDFKGLGEHESWSVAEARKRGVLVTELEAVPAEVEVGNGVRVRVKEAWVEERARSTHRFVWLAAEERVGGYRLHLTLSDGSEFVGQSARVVVREGMPEVRLDGHTRSSGENLYLVPLDHPDVSGLRLMLARRYEDQKGKEVRLVPQAHP